SLEIRPGDLLMSRACGSAELVGSVGLVKNCRRFLMLCDKLFRLLVNKNRVSSEFLELALKSRSTREQIEQNLGGAEGLARNIGQGVIKELIVCVPPPPEQDTIVEHIVKTAAKNYETLKRCRDGIMRLQEYRTALISAAVTGQIDVREEVGVA
ncbi:hypothetical protein N9N28_15610, partial [Rubripirellula amarantea]|nr:hypothetical protein [Rubripirellula amarantea]